MADLDDFFAKKDKKKSKSKKTCATDDSSKPTEDTLKGGIEIDKPRESPAAVSSPSEEKFNENSQQSADDEWKEFREEERRDYSGLKINQLTLSEQDKNHTNNGVEIDDFQEYHNGSANSAGAETKSAGPWKKVLPAEEVIQINVDKDDFSVVNSKVYISPAFRGQAIKSLKPRNLTAPDITNADYFPTLGAAKPEEQRKKKIEGAFEEVRHGSKIIKVQEVQTPQASVTNRFKSLEDDES